MKQLTRIQLQIGFLHWSVINNDHLIIFPNLKRRT